jgi:hypothetical protein
VEDFIQYATSHKPSVIRSQQARPKLKKAACLFKTKKTMSTPHGGFDDTDGWTRDRSAEFFKYREKR